MFLHSIQKFGSDYHKENELQPWGYMKVGGKIMHSSGNKLTAYGNQKQVCAKKLAQSHMK